MLKGLPKFTGKTALIVVLVCLIMLVGMSTALAVNFQQMTGVSLQWPESVKAADVNGDGYDDLLTTNLNYYDSTLGAWVDASFAVSLSNGDGTFQDPVYYPVGAAPQQFALADLNGDGILDAAVAIQNDNCIQVLLGNVDGTFQDALTFASGDLNEPKDVEVGDFNGDGVLDLAVAQSNYDECDTVALLFGTTGTSFGFADPVCYQIGDGSYSLTAGDYDLDGDLDLAVSTRVEYFGEDGEVTVYYIGILINDGNGGFGTPTNYAISGVQEITCADFNADGKPDLVAAGDLGVYVLLGSGDGTFADPVSYGEYTGYGRQEVCVAAGDFNGNGKLDLAGLNNDGYNRPPLSVWSGNGDGTFQAEVAWQITPDGVYNQFEAGSLAVGDFNNDGKPDLAICNYGTLKTVSIMLNNTPVNDDFPGTTISELSGSVTGSNIDATLEGDEPYHGYGLGEHTLWWSWTAQQDGTVVFDTDGSIDSYGDGMDTILAVYTGDSVGSLTLVAKNDDFDEDGDYQSQLAFKAVEGTTYRIVVDCYSSNDVGNIVLSWSYVTPAVGDDFPGTPISGAYGQDTGKSNVYATREPGEPLHNDSEWYQGQSSLWWTWTAPESGRFLFDTAGSLRHYLRYDGESSELYAVMAIYAGDSVNSLTPLAKSHSAEYSGVPVAAIDFNATGGTTYRIAVDGLDSYYTSLGNVVLNWNQVIAPSITSADDTTFMVGAAGTFTVIATGYPEPSISLTAGTLPSGVTFDSSTAELSGIPAAGTGGSYPLTFTAVNGIDPAATQSFTLTVNQPPSITSANHVTFKEGLNGSFKVTATGYPQPAVTLTDGTLPSGVTFDSSTTTLSGTPAAGTAGSYPLTFTAVNGIDPAATQNFTLTVVLEMPPVITAQPENTAVLLGDRATFIIQYNAYPKPAIQWQMSRDGSRWSNIEGAIEARYTTPNTKRNMDGYHYRVLLYNGIGGQVVSDAAILTVMTEPFTTADVSIEKQDGIYDSVTGTITWTIIVRNLSDGLGMDAEGVIVTDKLAKGTSFAAIDLSGISGSTYKVRGNTVDVNIGQLAADASVSFTITTAVNRATSPVENTATVTTTSYDPNLSNNTDSSECRWW
jgi:uncharacterized repeat protein (TIGR01451 family)